MLCYNIDMSKEIEESKPVSKKSDWAIGESFKSIVRLVGFYLPIRSSRSNKDHNSPPSQPKK